ncbi:septal ring lytic transglycosylase RlpA family protein [Brevundimonas sp.]|uniref:septal ring lytic transglycosylase RlpA family protein n=1 Tax=Brevundimonas sp. TaxID=1871086 RepID=UPI0025EA1377|nr:septal ring lytic transglycosylase RlpA family protein [Brevundimonas sp.]
MIWRICAAIAVALLASACGFAGAEPAPVRPQLYAPSVSAEVTDPAPIVRGTMRPYQVRGRWYTPEMDEAYDRTGVASWYGDAFHGRPTATGEIFDMHALTAAHTTLPLPSLVEVTNLQTGQSIIVRVNDRGPFVDDRLIDLSRGAADALGVRSQGLARVRVRYVGPAPRLGSVGPVQQAALTSPPAVSRPSEPADTTPYFIQVGTFGERDNAEALRRRLGRDGRVRIEDVRVGDRPMYRVLVGPWTGRTEAERERSMLAGQGLFDAILVRAQ